MAAVFHYVLVPWVTREANALPGVSFLKLAFAAEKRGFAPTRVGEWKRDLNFRS